MYAVSKAALDKLVEAWRAEHPPVGFTRLVVGDCAGGEGDAMTGFADDWDPSERWSSAPSGWLEYLSDSFIEVDELVTVVDSLIRHGGSLGLPSVTVTPRDPRRRSPGYAGRAGVAGTRTTAVRIERYPYPGAGLGGQMLLAESASASASTRGRTARALFPPGRHRVACLCRPSRCRAGDPADAPHGGGRGGRRPAS